MEKDFDMRKRKRDNPDKPDIGEEEEQFNSKAKKKEKFPCSGI